MSELPGRSEKDTAAYAFADAGDYVLGPDSLAKPGAPCGTVSTHLLKPSRIYPGVAHRCKIYRPEIRYGPPSSLMVFLDGTSFLDPSVNAAVVLDNLIDARDIPPMLGVFVDAGDRGPGLPLWGGSDNRSLEYDSTDDVFARFLHEEILPVIDAEHELTRDPDRRGIAGISSGGVAAFTVAWHRPDSFRTVMSFIGSFVDIRGANRYPGLIRRAAAKPLRVFLQSGSCDLDVAFGHWPTANRDMAAALAYREYDHQFVFGAGGHSMKHGAAILPDAMRWLWRDVLS
jgi:enterochelin esterase family protein